MKNNEFQKCRCGHAENDHPEKPLGFFLLGISFTSIGVLIMWRIRK